MCAPYKSNGQSVESLSSPEIHINFHPNRPSDPIHSLQPGNTVFDFLSSEVMKEKVPPGPPGAPWGPLGRRRVWHERDRPATFEAGLKVPLVTFMPSTCLWTKLTKQIKTAGNTDSEYDVNTSYRTNMPSSEMWFCLGLAASNGHRTESIGTACAGSQVSSMYAKSRAGPQVGRWSDFFQMQAL